MSHRAAGRTSSHDPSLGPSHRLHVLPSVVTDAGTRVVAHRKAHHGVEHACLPGSLASPHSPHSPPSRVPTLPKIALPSERPSGTPTSAGTTPPPAFPESRFTDSVDGLGGLGEAMGPSTALSTARSTGSSVLDARTTFVATARTKRFYAALKSSPRNLVDVLNDISSDPDFLALSDHERLDFCTHLLMHLHKVDLPEAPPRVRRSDVRRDLRGSPAYRAAKSRRRKYLKWKGMWFRRLRAVSVFVALHCVELERVLPLLRDLGGRLDHALIWLIQVQGKHARYAAALRRVLPYTHLTLKSILTYKGAFRRAWFRRALRVVGREPFVTMAAQHEAVRMFGKRRYDAVASWIVNH